MEYVIYCRRSSDESSDKQTQSIPDQIRRCIDFAEKNNLTIMKKPADFSDFETEEELIKEDSDSDLINRQTYHNTRHLFIIKESETGKVPYKRKKRRKLVALIKNEKIEGLLSYSPDRQARNILEGGELINYVDEGKIDLKYTNFHFEDTASGKMMLGVRFVFAKQYSDAISENVHRGNTETV
jgi:DNA invertase Pin-like site-specific DNA recombinase